MLGIFQKKLIKSDLFAGSMDRHCHILFGVDDGAKTVEESKKMIDGLKSLGFGGAYCTPHIMARYPENNSTRLKERFEELLEQVDLGGFELRLAAEYMLDEQFLEKLDKEEPLTYDGKRILVEFSQISLPSQWREMLFQLKVRNYIPVLAHPERYWLLIHSEEDKEILLEGCELQLNLLSLNGYYGRKALQNASSFIKENLYSHIGTDLHSSRQIEYFNNTKLGRANIASLKREIGRSY